MDIILLDLFTAPTDETEDDTTNAIANLLRVHTMNHYYSGLENVIEVMLTYPNVNYRYLMEPTGPYPHALRLLDFRNETTWPMQQNGRDDSQTALDYGPGFGFDTLNIFIEEHKYLLDDFSGDVRQLSIFLAEKYNSVRN